MDDIEWMQVDQDGDFVAAVRALEATIYEAAKGAFNEVKSSYDNATIAKRSDPHHSEPVKNAHGNTVVSMVFTTRKEVPTPVWVESVWTHSHVRVVENAPGMKLQVLTSRSGHGVDGNRPTIHATYDLNAMRSDGFRDELNNAIAKAINSLRASVL